MGLKKEIEETKARANAAAYATARKHAGEAGGVDRHARNNEVSHMEVTFHNVTITIENVESPGEAYDKLCSLLGDNAKASAEWETDTFSCGVPMGEGETEVKAGEERDTCILFPQSCAAKCGKDVRPIDAFGDGDQDDPDDPCFCSEECYDAGPAQQTED